MNFSRRDFARLLGATAAASALPPIAFAQNPKAAPREMGGGVRLSANENPYGPSPSALSAMHDALGLACRYPDKAADELIRTIAKINNVPTEQVILGDGSSEILKLTAAAFCSPTRKA